MYKQNSLFRYIITLFFAVFAYQLGFGQFNIPEKPNLETSVYDYANILSKGQASYLGQKLIKYADTTSTQIVIVAVKTLNGDDISLTATNWGHKWEVGQENKDNGIFILVASEDRKIDISTGYGIEYRLTDLMTERILNRVILPEFKQGDYFSGLDKGTDAIMTALNGEFEATDTYEKDNSGFHTGLVLLLGTMFFIIILSIIARGRKDDDDDYRGGKRSKNFSPFETIILSSGGKSYGGNTGGFDSGGYSGGFSGGGDFGGGSFGGGGASGSW